MNTVNQRVPKIDAMPLITGKGVYTEDLIPPNCLVVKLLRSPHPFAKIKSIKIDTALKVAGIECILTHQDVPKIRFTMAGQSYPEPSAYDRYILEDVVRYVGDPVAIVAGKDERCVDKAMKMIKVKYQLLEPVLEQIARFDILAPRGIMVAEHPADKVLPALAPPYRLGRTYRYGKICLTLYRRDANQENGGQLP